MTQNRALKAEKVQLKHLLDKSNTQNEQLRNQKREVETMVTMLQKEMMSNLTAAVQNSNKLQRDLEDAKARIRFLEDQPTNIDESLDVTIS